MRGATRRSGSPDFHSCSTRSRAGISPRSASQGWHCWEVGAGGPSVPAWLRGQVGDEGKVVATDIDTRWIADLNGSGVEVREHDVAHDDAPGEGFDLVHARLVLVHVAARDAALRRMAASLRPGGYLLLDDFDVALQPLACPHAPGPEHALANRIRAGFLELLVARGADLQYGRTLPSRFREFGLRDVTADAYLPLAMPAARLVEAAKVAQIREPLVALGRVSDDEIDAYLKALADGRLDISVPPLVSVRGRRQ
jgi:SAM-dependent methyltransferase